MPQPTDMASASGSGSKVAGPISNGALRAAVEWALGPEHFFVAMGHYLEWRHEPHEVTAWEVIQGRLVEEAHTRQVKLFESWNGFLTGPDGQRSEPVLSVKLDRVCERLHVTRAIHCYAWEGYHAGNNVYLSRETRKWVWELVGTLDLKRYGDEAILRQELAVLLFQAVLGRSRLPLTSIEAPLPAFSLGRFAYFKCAAAPNTGVGRTSLSSYEDLINRGLGNAQSRLERAKVLETVLRGLSATESGAAASLLAARWRELGQTGADLVRLCRSLFNETSLSPYTGFVDTMLAFWQALVGNGLLPKASYVDLLSYLLRQTSRHLTAYDLKTFHHRGANYPDALLLDAVLREYLAVLEDEPALFQPSRSPKLDFQARLRRRALRQAWLLWHFYKGLAVPDAPTSPGENMRVLPPPHVRVPEEQIHVSAKRTKRLFSEAALPRLSGQAQVILEQCFADLEDAQELQELGTAVFLDRPLGVFKAPTEPDQTILLSYEAVSRRIAEQRVGILARTGCLRDEQSADLQSTLRNSATPGPAVRPGGRGQRPGAVSLDDALRAADDFVLVRTLPQAVKEFLGDFDLKNPRKRYELGFLDASQPLLIVHAPAVGEGSVGDLFIYGSDFRRRLELQIDMSLGYHIRGGREYPAAGLRVLRVWAGGERAPDLCEHDLRGVPERISVFHAGQGRL
jgi:hypothetical protein